VSPHLELLPTLLVHMRASQDRVTLDPGRKWNWTTHPSSRRLRRFHDIHRTLVEDLVVVRFHTNLDLVVLKHAAYSLSFSGFNAGALPTQIRGSLSLLNPDIQPSANPRHPTAHITP